MISNESILTLIDRIGFEKTLNSDVMVAVNSSNQTSNSGRKLNSFHQLATVENIYSAVAQVNMEELEFNAFLSSIREQSVREVVTAIMYQSHLYDDLVDYSNTLISRPVLFDDAIGYCIAIKILELLISSTRINATERSASLSYQALKVELEGAKNDNGFTIAKGIVGKYERAVKKAQKIIFPDPILIIGGNDW